MQGDFLSLQRDFTNNPNMKRDPQTERSNSWKPMVLTSQLCFSHSHSRPLHVKRSTLPPPPPPPISISQAAWRAGERLVWLTASPVLGCSHSWVPLLITLLPRASGVFILMALSFLTTLKSLLTLHKGSWLHGIKNRC